MSHLKPRPNHAPKVEILVRCKLNQLIGRPIRPLKRDADTDKPRVIADTPQDYVRFSKVCKGELQ
jgi:hypothetical protein